MTLPPGKQTIIAPKNGWEPKTYYIVEVAFNKANPIHRAIFYSGFLNAPVKNPDGYNQIWNPSYEPGETKQITDAHYLKVIRKIKGVEK